MSTQADLSNNKSFLAGFMGSSLQYWSGHVANYTMVVMFVALAFFPQRTLSWIQLLATALLGLMVWTFAEYVFHRWLYHKNSTLIAKGHGMHHDAPEALLGMPWYVNVVVLSALVWALSFWIGLASSGLFVGSFWLGHVWYTWMHHAMHHFDWNVTWFRKLKNHHKIHHKIPDRNLGVVTIFWDLFCRTSD